MPKKLDLAGMRFVRLLVLSTGSKRGREHYWLVRCECGVEKEVSTHSLRAGNATSCGCLKRERSALMNRSHGMYGSPTYTSWRAMMDRCAPNGAYAKLGTRVCKRWRKFENFLADMGERPPGRMSIDRIDNSGHYEPGNCRWTDYGVQARNRRLPSKGTDGRFCGPSSIRLR